MKTLVIIILVATMFFATFCFAGEDRISVKRFANPAWVSEQPITPDDLYQVQRWIMKWRAVILHYPYDPDYEPTHQEIADLGAEIYRIVGD